MGLTIVTGPASEPLTLAEAKLHCRVDTDDSSQDDVLTELIAAMRERCEAAADRALVTQTLKLTLDAWPDDDVIRLPRAPLASVSSVKYRDPDTGALTTLAADQYTADTTGEPGRITPSYDAGTWPSAREQVAAIEVTYVAGVAAGSVSKAIKERLKVAIGYCWENREQRDEEYLDRLFAPFWIGAY